MTDYEVVAYEGGRDPEIAALVLFIQNEEAGIDLTIDEQPDLLDIPNAYRSGGFWVALDGHRVVGTIGMLRYGPAAVLKKFFVARDHRGPTGPAAALYDRAIGWVREEGLEDVFLDTPSVAGRSHAFYRRKGFQVVERYELPPGYAFPDRDSLIFRLHMRDPVR